MRPTPPPDPSVESLRSDPRLGPLVRTVTAAGTPGELRDRSAVLQQYRSAQGQGATRRRRALWPRTMAAVAAVALGGVGTAAYASVLPSAAQGDLHRILGPLGVPAPAAPSPAGTRPAVATGPGGARRAAAPAPGSATPRPAPRAARTAGRPSHVARRRGVGRDAQPPPPKIVLEASPSRVRWDHAVVLDARLDPRAAGRLVTLEARTDRRAAVSLRRLRVPESGWVSIRLPELRQTTRYELVGPGGTVLATVRVAVPVPLSVVVSPGVAGDVGVMVAAAAPTGESAVELQRRDGRRWVVIGRLRLDASSRGSGAIPARSLPPGARLRAVVAAGPWTARSVSPVVVVAVREAATSITRTSP